MRPRAQGQVLKVMLRGVSLSMCLAAMACSQIAPGSLCKPVVPQIAIDFGPSPLPDGLTQILLRYDERGSVPFTQEAFTGNPRMSFCDIAGNRCVAARARYETRLDPERFQSIQIWGNNGKGNHIIGAVRWKGPSYPERVAIACDVAETDTRRSCKLEELVYTPDPDAPHSYASSHDQCRP